jgi:hypothetical protein
LREVLLVAGGAIVGSMLGIIMMSLLQVSRDCRIIRKEDTDYEEEKYSEDSEI